MTAYALEASDMPSQDTPLLILETGQPLPAMRRHGGFAHWIRVAAGLEARHAQVVDVEAGAAPPDPGAFAGIIVTGSGAMVTDRHHWSERSAAWLHDAVHDGVPVLGICYGHQLLAHALGGEVGDNPRGREMGTVDISLTPQAGDDPLFAALPPRFAVQATHLQSVLRLPDEVEVLARNAHDGHHAFRWRRHAWGVQFHPEFSAMHMRGYIRARAAALVSEGSCPSRMHDAVAAAPHARNVLRRFVRHLRQERRDAGMQ